MTLNDFCSTSCRSVSVTVENTGLCPEQHQIACAFDQFGELEPSFSSPGSWRLQIQRGLAASSSPSATLSEANFLRPVFSAVETLITAALRGKTSALRDTD